MFDLVKTITKDDLILHGLFAPGEKKKTVLLHIHGFEGDFYTNEFTLAIAQKLYENRVSFLTVQTRGTGSEYLLKTTDGQWKRYGAHFELLEEAYKDIDAWIEFLQKRGYTTIILEGHSLGTMKVIRYLFEGSYPSIIKKLILLSPFDHQYYLEKVAKSNWQDNLKITYSKIKEGRGEECLPPSFDHNPISYKTYVSWYKDTEVSRMFNFYNKSYTFSLLRKLSVPVKVIVGSKDEYFHPSNPNHPEAAIEIMKKHIKDFSYKLIENADHSFTGYEATVAHEVFDFI